MAQPLASPFSYFTDANGAPLAGGFVYTYAAGTTTPQASYTDSSGVTPAANPVVLDSAGRATIWLSGNYKIVVKDYLGNTISTTDNIVAATSTGNMSTSVYDAANIQEQVVGLTAVQTLTNKTLTTPAITGVSDGSAAAAGKIGEIITATLTSGSAVSLVTATAKTVTSIDLTAGQWQINGTVIIVSASSTTTTLIAGAINTTTNVLPALSSNGYAVAQMATVTGSATWSLATGTLDVNVPSTTTYYLIAQSNFGVSTTTAYGKITARRVR